MPLVSVCIPTYNHARFLERALLSASAQSSSDLEILVVDNASQDDTGRMVAEAAARDGRIRYVRHPENIGLVGNFDACIHLASGRYVKFLCSDDALEPDCVSTMVEVFEREPGVSLVACGRIISDQDLAPLRVLTARSGACRVEGPQMIAECFFLGNRIGEPTAVMFRRADALRGFRRDYHQLLDLEMWFHLLKMGDFFSLPHPLCRIRRHSAQATRTNDKEGRIVEERRLLYGEFSAVAKRYASFPRRCVWDFRMAYALARSEAAGYVPAYSSVGEVYFRRAFKQFTRPVVRLMMGAGLERIRRAS